RGGGGRGGGGHGGLLMSVGCVGAVPAQRQHHRGAGDGIGGDVGVQGEHLVGHLLGDDLGRGALGVDLAAVHGDQVIGVAGGEVEVVQHDAHGDAALPVQVAHHVEDLELVGDVEIGGGFVQQQHLRLLGERHRDPHPLALPAGELLEQPVLQRVGAGGGERL